MNLVGGGGVDSPIKMMGMLAVLLWGVNDLVSREVFGMESHFSCLFRYHLELCIKKFTKNAVH